MLRWAWMLSISLVAGCGGGSSDSPTTPGCTADCTDSGTTSSGTPTGSTYTVPTFTGTTGPTNPSSPLTLAIDPTIAQWQHQVGLTQCPQNLGRVILENTSAEQAHLSVGSIRFEGENVFSFSLDGDLPDFFVDRNIPAAQQSVVTVYYACNATHSFGHTIDVLFEHATDDAQDNAATIFSEGTIIQ